jgi:D-aspartate ligase
MNDSTPQAYVLGAGVIALGILRSLGRRGVPVTVFSGEKDDIAHHSRFGRVISLHSPGDALAIATQLVREASALPSKPVLFVSGDSNLRIACAQAALLESAMHVVLPTLDAALTVLEKDRFQAFAVRHDLPVPRGWTPQTREELESVIESENLSFPVVLKPQRSGEWRSPDAISALGLVKMLRADSATELRERWAKVASLAGPPVVQEYVRGNDDMHFSYVSYVSRSGAEATGFVVRKHRLFPIHGGLSTFASVVDEPDIALTGREIIAQLGYRNASSVCFKRDSVTGKPWVFEVNGRIPMVFAAGTLAGIDLAWIMYRDALGMPLKHQGSDIGAGRWVALTQDISAMRQYRKAGQMGMLEWLGSLLRARYIVEFDPLDLGPFLYFVKSHIRRLLR